MKYNLRLWFWITFLFSCLFGIKNLWVWIYNQRGEFPVPTDIIYLIYADRVEYADIYYVEYYILTIASIIITLLLIGIIGFATARIFGVKLYASKNMR